MDNPESSSVPINLMYQYQRNQQVPWLIGEYKTPAAYLDSNLQVLKRKWATQKKGQKDNKTVTKRGFYMDYKLKVSKGIPSARYPDDHGKQEPWATKKTPAHCKVNTSLKKDTYLDKIELEQKNRKSPGVSTYKLVKSLKEIEEENSKRKPKVRPADKHYFYQDIEHLGAMSPGSGNYNPHKQIQHIKLNKTDYKFWVAKHRDERDVHFKRESVSPSSHTYSPMSLSFATFSHLASKSNKKTKETGFGTDSRFPYTRPDKKVIKEKRPDPISYQTRYDWKGKTSRDRPWNHAIWKGMSQTFGVYH